MSQEKKLSALERSAIIMMGFSAFILNFAESQVIQDTAMLIILALIIIICSFVMPLLKSFKSVMDFTRVSLGRKLLWFIHGVNSVLCMGLAYLIFISNSVELHLTYWIFLGSVLILFILFKILGREQKTNENRGLSLLATLLFLVVTWFNLLPIFYIASPTRNAAELTEINSSTTISVYNKGEKLETNSWDKTYSAEFEISDQDLIAEIVSELNQNKGEVLTGTEALNHLKRVAKVTHYELGFFHEVGGEGFLMVELYPDGKTVIGKYCHSTGLIRPYFKYYKMQFSATTMEKIVAIK